ncbi:Crp/Fnr family transcriptional regulator [Dyadobacter chenwenxiniae]|uniref:Crp/Fnr family transcriptional regulator n=1 Tax=Dyadobacter chenwenxiniae TaxID=2906456 RepID=A0A9X1TI68_9BACT|nr:Crp/Fnr family transcriptional regulator [Dyadobacter chenwenxiniae]MCF0065530.1 Crp/Fnr family transcriptional regulator [Dyadobacter chenwenxiniae]UON85442.1 Crp/Fnr family transcriptional regulator [Dyadobacter chenwenxiniae]
MENPFCKSFFDLMGEDVELDEQSKNLIDSHCREVTIKKGAVVLNAGDVCQQVFFVLTGEAISFFLDTDGKTTTWFFHFNNAHSTVKNLFAVDYKSFVSGQAATLTVEALTDVRAIHFSRAEVDFLLDNCAVFERWMRKLSERAFIHTYDRIATFLTMSAKHRYLKLLEEEPHLLNMFSNYYIATYLGIVPQSLSRIRQLSKSA